MTFIDARVTCERAIAKTGLSRCLDRAKHLLDASRPDRYYPRQVCVQDAQDASFASSALIFPKAHAQLGAASRKTHDTTKPAGDDKNKTQWT